MTDTTSSAVDQLATLVKVQGELLNQTLSHLAHLAVPPTAPPDPLAQLRDLLAIAKELGPPAPPAPAAAAGPTVSAEAPPWLHVLDRAERVLERLLERQAPAGAATPGGAPPTEEGAPLPPAIEELIREVCRAADAGEVPEHHARSLAVQLTPEETATLAPLFVGETARGFPSNIISAVPALHQRRAWVGPFLYAFRGNVWPRGKAVVVPDVEEEKPGTDNGARKRRKGGAGA